jgi:hypothetical protein
MPLIFNSYHALLFLSCQPHPSLTIRPAFPTPGVSQMAPNPSFLMVQTNPPCSQLCASPPTRLKKSHFTPASCAGISVLNDPLQIYSRAPDAPVTQINLLAKHMICQLPGYSSGVPVWSVEFRVSELRGGRQCRRISALQFQCMDSVVRDILPTITAQKI